MDTRPRNASPLVEEALADTRVILINGARQAGKSTLAGLILDRHDARLWSLDDPQILAAAKDDPRGFVSHEGMVGIDEIQRAPELLLPIKHEVDSDTRPGRFLLTGSARLLGLKSLPDALPGRMETIELWPFSQGELVSKRDGFVDAIFSYSWDGPLPKVPGISRRDVAERVVRGGFPAATMLASPRRRRRFFANYVGTLIDRDIRQLSDIEQAGDLRRLLQLVAMHSGRLLVAANLAADLSISTRTVARYLELCEEVFLIKRIPGWSSNLGKRAVGTPKVAFVDSGIAAYLIGQDVDRLLSPGGFAGPLVEGFVAMELARQLTWADEEVRMFHYRTKDKVEVDVVLETPDGRVAGVEVKAGATVHSDDFRGLRLLEKQTGPAFVGGFVLYAGEDTLSFGPRLKALPLSALWELSPPHWS